MTLDRTSKRALLDKLIVRAAQNDRDALIYLIRRNSSHDAMQLIASALMHEPLHATPILVGWALLNETPPISVKRLVVRCAPSAIMELASDAAAPVREALHAQGNLEGIALNFEDIADPSFHAACVTISVAHGFIARFLYLSAPSRRSFDWRKLDDRTRESALRALLANFNEAAMAMIAMGSALLPQERQRIVLASAFASHHECSAGSLAWIVETLTDDEWRALPVDARMHIIHRLADEPEAAAAVAIGLFGALSNEERRQFAQAVIQGDERIARAADGDPSAIAAVISSNRMFADNRRMLAASLLSTTPAPAVLAVGAAIFDLEIPAKSGAYSIISSHTLEATILLANDAHEGVRRALRAERLLSNLARQLATQHVFDDPQGRAALASLATDDDLAAVIVVCRAIDAEAWHGMPKQQRAALIEAVQTHPSSARRTLTHGWIALRPAERSALIQAVAVCASESAELLEFMDLSMLDQTTADDRALIINSIASDPIVATRAAGAPWRHLRDDARDLVIRSIEGHSDACAMFVARMRDDDWSSLPPNRRAIIWQTALSHPRVAAHAVSARWMACNATEKDAAMRVMECDYDAVAVFLQNLSHEGWRSLPPEPLDRLMNALDPLDAASLACERWNDIPCSTRSMLVERASHSPHAAAAMITNLGDVWDEIDETEQNRIVDAASKDQQCAARALAAIMAMHWSKPAERPNLYYARTVLMEAMQVRQRVRGTI